MKEEKLEVSYGEIIDKFKNHLSQKHNKHIFFSGKYGIGKSTFLQHFFKEHPEYYTVTLFPVNYVVSSNENIFELIKVDIIKQLYDDNHIDFEEELKTNKISASINYILNKPLEFTKHITNTLSKLHPVMELAAKGSEGIHALIKSFSDYEDELNNKLKSNDQILINHAEDFHSVPGTYLEFDLITSILRENLKAIKEKNKETILIIDDLDRLDPEHIFRLLNIFSSHKDNLSNEHKFGFDKVLFVADYCNIERLFKHRYGEMAEFAGYIDKFYSDEIFNFSNNDALINFLKKEFQMKLRVNELNVLKSLLETFVKHDKISIRNIIKYKNISLPNVFKIDETNIQKFRLSLRNDIQYIDTNVLWFNSDDVQVINLISILSSFFGSLERLKEVLNELNKTKELIENEYVDDYFNTFAVILRYIQFTGNEKIKQYFNIVNNVNDSRFHVDISSVGPKGNCFSYSYQLILYWNYRNKYDGTESYFHKVEVQIKYDETQEIKILKEDVFSALIQIISFIENNKLENKLNIFS